MHDAIESELIAAHLAPFGKDRSAWLDAYATARSTDPNLGAAEAMALAAAAWESHGWAHPAVVARLEHLLGSLSAD